MINKFIDKLIPFPQGGSNACTVYACVHISNAQNIIEYGYTYKQVDPWTIYKKMIIKKPSLTKGVYPKEMIEWLKKEKYILGYIVVSKKEQIKKALDLNCGIVCYTAGCNFKRTGETKVFNTEPCQYGKMKRDEFVHAFAILGYDEEGMHAINSEGPGRGDRGWFHIPWERLDMLHELKALVDKDGKNNFISIGKQIAHV